MRDTLIKLTVILCTLLARPTFAGQQVELYPVHNKADHHTGYAVKVMIGNPEKEFSVLLDTVTAFLWVVGPDSKHPFCHGKTTYSKVNSNTCTTLISSPQTQLHGCQSVTIDSLDEERLNFTNSPFGTLLMLQWPELEDYQQIDGVFGLSALHIKDTVNGVLGFPSPYLKKTYDTPHLPTIETDKIADNPIKKAIREKQLEPIITIALPSLDSYKTAVLMLGGRDDKLCDLENEKNEWLVDFGNRYDFEYLSINMGNATSLNKFLKTYAYPDTTKPYIGVPDQFMQQIVRNLNATKNETTKKYMVDCQGSFEPFVMYTHTNIYTLEPEHFIIKHNQEDTQCELAFRSHGNIFDQTVVLGIPFFHQFCVTLEPRDGRINFAPII
uniref:Peptidase A1 domain-containing protein n=1 Tax=Onchocerca volvulus TaxID=6282 RepID=A0A2K6VT25_ONCVO